MADQNVIQIIVQVEDKATDALHRTADAAQDVQQRGGSAISGFGQVAIGALREVGAAAVNALAAAGQAVAGFVSDSIGAAGTFEAGMNTFAAAAGVGGAELEGFKQQFIDLGKELPVSTKEVQDAATAMVKGGIEPAVVAGGALRDTLQFAAAAGMGLEAAADLTAKQLGTFVPLAASAAEKTKFMAESQELLVKAANASTLDVEKLGSAMLAAGGQAKAIGMDYKDFVTTMGLISPAFGSAAEAGTSFKNLLARLQPTTKAATQAMEDLGLITKDGQNVFFDAQGNFLGAANAAEQLKKATAGLSDAERMHYMQTIFGNDAMGAAIALAASGSEGYDKFAASMANANGIQGQAAATQQGFNFAMENMKGSLEALQITLGTAFLPTLTDLVTKGTDALNIVIKFTDTFLKLAPAIGESANPIQTFLQVLGIAVSSVFPGAGAGLLTLAGAFSSTESAVSTISGAVMGFLSSVGGSLVAQLQVWAQALGQWVIDAMPGLGANLAAFLQTALTWIASALPPIVAQLAVWAVEFSNWLIVATPLFLQQAGIFLDSMLNWLIASLPSIVAQLGLWAAQFVSWLVDVTPKIIVAAADLLAKFLVWFGEFAAKLQENTTKWRTMFYTWIAEAAPKVMEELGHLGQQLVAYLNDLATKAKADGSVGKAIIDGIKSGINSGVESIKRAAVDAANAALKAAKEALGIHSPSLVFQEEVGRPMALGMAQGFMDGASVVAAASQQVARIATGAAVPATSSTTINNNGGNTITVTPQPHHDERRLAEAVADLLSGRDRR